MSYYLAVYYYYYLIFLYFHLFSERYQTLSPIPSSTSLSTIPIQTSSKISTVPEGNLYRFINYKCLTKMGMYLYIIGSKLPRRNSFGYRTLKIIQKGISRKNSRSMTMQHQSSAADMFDMLTDQEMFKISPLIRPREFRQSFSYSP